MSSSTSSADMDIVAGLQRSSPSGGAESEAEVEESKEPGVFARGQGASWWVVSVLLHVLVIVLASLVSLAIQMPDANDTIITVTEIARRPELQQDEPPKKNNDSSKVLESNHDTPPTDPTSTEVNDIVVPPDILAKAELGDHFETINPDRPDTQSAFGNPDAHMFHSVEGNDDAAGGGGMGGASLEDMIGVGGAASPGTGGGWGGGNGTGVGVDNGSGKGSFGTRTGGGRKLMVKRHGGSKATEEGVEAGLAWLARHQQDDGHWLNGKHGGGEDNFDRAIAGLATLAFLGAGHTDKIGVHKETVAKALNYIISLQDNEGYIGGCGYVHAICTMALSEAYGMTRNQKYGDAAQKAVNWAIEKHQTLGTDNYSRSGWEYKPRGERPTTAVTAWFIMALKSAKVAGLKVDSAGFEGGLHFLDTVTKIEKAEKADVYNPADVTVYYRPPNVFYEAGAVRHEDHIRRMQATGLLVRLFTGSKRGDAIVDGGIKKVFDSGLPDWNRKDVYHWYYGTYVMFQAGGDEWKKWNEALKNALIPNQIKVHRQGTCNCKDCDDYGSWDPDNESYCHKSRVWVTTACILSLEVYYRYKKIQDDPGH